MAKKAALGKGMASLLGTDMGEMAKKSNIFQELRAEAERAAQEELAAPVAGPIGPLMVSVESIVVNPNQPRKVFKDKELAELANSIQENGIIQPLIVCEIEGGFSLIAGERRLRAAKLLQMEQVPVVVKRGTDKDKMIMSIIENVQRADLNCVEEALAYFDLMNTFKLTQEEVAKKLGKERSSIANYLRILKLPRTVIEMIEKELLSFGHAKLLAAIEDKEHAKRLANQVAAENLSVRELEKLIARKKTPLVPKEKEERNQEQLDTYRQNLEKRTGFHFHLVGKKNGAGQIVINYNNEAEFSDIYNYLIKR